MEEKLEQIKDLTKKEILLETLSNTLRLTNLEVMNLISILKGKGQNIITTVRDDGIVIINHGDRRLNNSNTYNFSTDDRNEFKAILISDTRFGSKYQQKSIINDIYQKGYDMGYRNVIHGGNITEGLYSLTDDLSSSVFLNDSMQQIDYVVDNYPKVDGMTTYFITGSKDKKHLAKRKIDIGKAISRSRQDMIYLGVGNCTIYVDNVKILLKNFKLSKTYTVSYRAQQSVNSLRSEIKPDILLLSGLCQIERFEKRSVEVFSIPSVTATTMEMSDRSYNNTVGSWYITIRTNKKGQLEGPIESLESEYYVTDENDYLTSKTLVKKGQ